MKLPKIHIRDIFWCMTLIAVVLGWMADRNRQRDLSRQRLQNAVERASRTWDVQWNRAADLQKQNGELRQQIYDLQIQKRVLRTELDYAQRPRLRQPPAADAAARP